MSRTDITENRLRNFFHDALGTHPGGTMFLRFIRSVVWVNDDFTVGID
jgi:hypothetical protein